MDLFHREVDYASLNNMYDETFDGGTLSLTKALGYPGLKGGFTYTLEYAHVSILPGFTTNLSTNYSGSANGTGPRGRHVMGPNISTNIMDQHGTYYHFGSRSQPDL